MIFLRKNPFHSTSLDSFKFANLCFRGGSPYLRTVLKLTADNGKVESPFLFLASDEVDGPF